MRKTHIPSSGRYDLRTRLPTKRSGLESNLKFGSGESTGGSIHQGRVGEPCILPPCALTSPHYQGILNCIHLHQPRNSSIYVRVPSSPFIIPRVLVSVAVLLASECSESPSLSSSLTLSNDPPLSLVHKHMLDECAQRITSPHRHPSLVTSLPAVPVLGIKLCPREVGACHNPRRLVLSFLISNEWFPHVYKSMEEARAELVDY